MTPEQIEVAARKLQELLSNEVHTMPFETSKKIIKREINTVFFQAIIYALTQNKP